MKRYIPCLFALLILLATACTKTVPFATAAQPTTGTYTGQFAYLHRSNDVVAYDTLTANVTLALNNSAGTFTVTGDTTTLHAGSYGTYTYYGGYMVFTDKTYSSTASALAKKHLSGYYTFSYDGTKLSLLGTIADTAAFVYTLTKQ